MDRPSGRRSCTGRIDAADTVLFGSTNGTTPGVLHMRWGRRTYANCRPMRWRPGLPLAAGRARGHRLRDRAGEPRGRLHRDHGRRRRPARSGLVGPQARLVYDGRGSLRGQGHHPRRAPSRSPASPYELARRRRQQGIRKLTVSAKTNMLPQHRPLVLRHRPAEIGSDYPDVPLRAFIVDDMAHRLVCPPDDLDVLLLPNLYGDVLSRRGRGDDRRPRAGAVGLLRRRLRLLRVVPRHGARHRRPATASTRRRRCSAR